MSQALAPGSVRPVLHLIDALDCGGAQQLLVELAKVTPRDRYPTSVAVIQPPDELAERLESLGVTVHRLGRRRVSIARPFGFLAYLAGTLLDVYRLCRRGQVAILHNHLADAELLGVLAGRLARVPMVLDTVHTPRLLPKRHFLDPRGWLRARLTPLVFNLADLIVAVSGETSDALSRLGVDPRKLRVVENGVAIDEHPSPPDPALRLSLGLDPGDLVVVTAARLMPQKGLKYLIRAMPAVVERFPRVRLLLLGEGQMRRELESKVRARGLSGNVFFLGVRSDVREILRLADVFVLPSYWEGTSLALLEAMAMGRPIVATAIKGNQAILRHEFDGLLVHPRDSDALAQGIIRLLSDPGLASTLGRQARLSLESGHSISAMFKAYEALWCSRAGEGNRP